MANMRHADPVDAVWWDATSERMPRAWPLEAITWAYRPRVTSDPAGPGYWRHRPGKVVVDWPATDPAPVVVNTDPRPEGAPEDPRAVKSLQRAAQAAGWATRTGYSRGLLRTRSIGVYKDVEIIGVWSGEKDGTRWYAMYERTVGAKTGWKWGAITLWSRGKPMESGLTITQLLERLFRA